MLWFSRRFKNCQLWFLISRIHIFLIRFNYLVLSDNREFESWVLLIFKRNWMFELMGKVPKWGPNPWLPVESREANHLIIILGLHFDFNCNQYNLLLLIIINSLFLLIFWYLLNLYYYYCIYWTAVDSVPTFQLSNS